MWICWRPVGVYRLCLYFSVVHQTVGKGRTNLVQYAASTGVISWWGQRNIFVTFLFCSLGIIDFLAGVICIEVWNAANQFSTQLQEISVLAPDHGSCKDGIFMILSVDWKFSFLLGHRKAVEVKWKRLTCKQILLCRQTDSPPARMPICRGAVPKIWKGPSYIMSVGVKHN